MTEIFSKMISRGNRQCKLSVFVDDESCCLTFTALGRTNPPNKGKRERFTIFDETYQFASLDDIDPLHMPFVAKTAKFEPLSKMFAALFEEFREAK
ncbi:hypothetical protein IFG57_004010 [Salmonella enterica]|nr:hypothetical protein [Salmonella enterica]